MASTIQLRVDDELKTRSDELFKDLGTDTLDKLEKSRQNAAQGAHAWAPFLQRKW